jgi:hypothetical protein
MARRLLPRARVGLRFFSFSLAFLLCACAAAEPPSSAPSAGSSAQAVSCEAGIAFEQRGQNRMYPSAQTKTDAPSVVGLAASSGVLFLFRDGEIGAIASDRSSGPADIATRWTAPPLAPVDGGLAIIGDRVVWNADKPYAMPVAGGAPAELLPHAASRIAIDGATVFDATTPPLAASGSDSPLELSRDGVAFARVPGLLNVTTWQMAEDDQALYVATWAYEGDSGVFRVAKADGTVTPIIPRPPNADCDWAVLDGDDAYTACLRADRTGFDLFRVPKNGGTATTIPAPEVPRQWDSMPVSADSGYIYGATGDEVSRMKGIVRIDTRTGVSVDVFAAPGTMTAYTHDGSCFYVATQECTCLENNGPNKGGQPGGAACSLNDCTTRVHRQPEPPR